MFATLLHCLLGLGFLGYALYFIRQEPQPIPGISPRVHQVLRYVALACFVGMSVLRFLKAFNIVD